MISSVVVLDNGAGFCKAGMAGQVEPTAIVPNCLARPRTAKKWMVADQLQECDDIQSIAIKRPMDRGYLISPETEREIWDRIFKTLLKVLNLAICRNHKECNVGLGCLGMCNNNSNNEILVMPLLHGPGSMFCCQENFVPE